MKKLSSEGSATVRVRVPPEWVEKLRAMTDEENSFSEVVRLALRRFLKV